MKKALYIPCAATLLALLLSAATLPAQGCMTSMVQTPAPDNEWEPNEEGKDVFFFCSPVTLGGSSLEDSDLMAGRAGLLSLVECEQYKPSEAKIPFRVYLRRNGIILESGLSSSTEERFQVEMSALLKLAQHGDLLIINPVRKRDFRAKRILRVVEGC